MLEQLGSSNHSQVFTKNCFCSSSRQVESRRVAFAAPAPRSLRRCRAPAASLAPGPNRAQLCGFLLATSNKNRHTNRHTNTHTNTHLSRSAPYVFGGKGVKQTSLVFSFSGPLPLDQRKVANALGDGWEPSVVCTKRLVFFSF